MQTGRCKMTAWTAIRVFTLLALTGVLVGAQEQTPVEVSIETSVFNKYVWRGYDVFDDHGSFQPSVNIEAPGTGFGVNVWGSFALADGYEDLDELDYTVAYGQTLFGDAAYALDVGLAYVYYDFPNTKSRFADGQELGLSLALPKLLPLGDSAIVPSYFVADLWPSRSGRGNPDGGWFHIVGLSYDLAGPAFMPGQDEQTYSFTWDLTYNDGAFDADHDWSHTTFGLAIPFEVGPLAITPMLRYQLSFDDSVNDEDELYGGVSVAVSF